MIHYRKVFLLIVLCFLLFLLSGCIDYVAKDSNNNVKAEEDINENQSEPIKQSTKLNMYTFQDKLSLNLMALEESYSTKIHGWYINEENEEILEVDIQIFPYITRAEELKNEIKGWFNGGLLITISEQEMYQQPRGYIYSITEGFMDEEETVYRQRILVYEETNLEWSDLDSAIWYTISDQTEIIDSEGNLVSFEALEVGQYIEPWYFGQMLESFPGQTGASKIVLLQEPVTEDGLISQREAIQIAIKHVDEYYNIGNIKLEQNRWSIIFNRYGKKIYLEIDANQGAVLSDEIKGIEDDLKVVIEIGQVVESGKPVILSAYMKNIGEYSIPISYYDNLIGFNIEGENYEIPNSHPISSAKTRLSLEPNHSYWSGINVFEKSEFEMILEPGQYMITAEANFNILRLPEYEFMLEGIPYTILSEPIQVIVQ